jgi:hypothetical protein
MIHRGDARSGRPERDVDGRVPPGRRHLCDSVVDASNRLDRQEVASDFA